MAKSVFALILALSLAGCSTLVGTSTPVFHTAENGDVIIGHEVKGVGMAFGDGGVGQNVEGGNISESAAELLESIIGGGLKAVGAVFSGFGSVGDALSGDEEELASN